MLSIIKSAALRGIDAIEITVEIDAAHGGLPGEALVGLPSTVVRESKNRIKSAIKNSGFKYPLKFYTINLAPADIPKEGPYFDVPIAVGILQATDQVKASPTTLFVGELSLNGDVKPIRGAISICHMAQKLGYTHIVLPFDNESEARWISGITIVPVKTLAAIHDYLNGKFIPLPSTLPSLTYDPTTALDYSDVRGQLISKRAMEIAASGQHNVLLIGTPGSGKTMLLRRLPGIMPSLTVDEAIETFKIHSVAGKHDHSGGFTLNRPFRNPHHSISYAGLIGGGSKPIPGEISLAHNGILFLDELPEFPRNVIEVLRQPLEDKKITITRAEAHLSYPANCLFVAAMNPCPCGYFGDQQLKCTCHPDQVRKYWKKISGPILDRIDLVVPVEKLKASDLAQNNQHQDSFYSSQEIKSRVLDAILFQSSRGSKSNAMLAPKELQKHCKIDSKSEQLLAQALEKGLLSGRSYMKVLKIARTIADLAKETEIKFEHVSEAVMFRRSIEQFKKF